jgi:hypothetical protein
MFEANGAAVVIGELGRPVLGNLRNPSHGDDGGNVFGSDNTWHIFCYQGHNIKAEGNDFGTGIAAEINAKIWDLRDDASLGKVDFRPFILPPSALRAAAQPTVTGLVARSTGPAAEVRFFLAASANVSCVIRNLAGRPVRAIGLREARPAGANCLLWDRRCDNGLPVPAGRYLVEVVAWGPEGQQASTVVPLTIDQ